MRDKVWIQNGPFPKLTCKNERTGSHCGHMSGASWICHYKSKKKDLTLMSYYTRMHCDGRQCHYYSRWRLQCCVAIGWHSRGGVETCSTKR